MTLNSQKQTGSAHVIILIILVVAIIGVLGFVFWQSFMKSDTTKVANTTSETSDWQNTQAVETISYSNETIGVKFDYPKDWLKVECDDTYIENPQRTLYFGTNEYGLDITESGISNLCGGGTDFPAQMTIKRVGADAELEGAFTNVTIDGKNAKKYTIRTGQDGTIRGLEITRYVVAIESEEYIVLSYNRFPEFVDDKRDNSEASLLQFTKFVEQNVRFL